jgi:hypothetical protein
MMRGAIVVVGQVVLAACGARSSLERQVGIDAGGSSSSFSVPMCSWPASLNDAGPYSCTPSQSLVECDLASGGSCFCLSSGEPVCSGCGNLDGGTCKALCGSREYGLVCGGLGPPPEGANLTPPQGCRVAVNEGLGPSHYCCPCQ